MLEIGKFNTGEIDISLVMRNNKNSDKCTEIEALPNLDKWLKECIDMNLFDD